MANDVKWLSISELREGGYLQEVNRQFFHPLGLALAISVDESGACKLAGIWDCRADHSGVAFSDSTGLKDAADKIASAWREREEQRRETFGWMIQPAE